MLPRVLEPEVMDTPDDAADYDSMDHAEVNRRFAADFLAVWDGRNMVLDVGTGTAQIPIELCRQDPRPVVLAIDMADHMLTLARSNIDRAGLRHRIPVQKADGKRLPSDSDATFAAVVSNSIIHHIPEPFLCLAEMHRVCVPGGRLFVRDLFRPADEPTLNHLVETYAAGANPHQRALFAASLHAALTVDEVRELVGRLGYPPHTVEPTSDRHWTWSAVRPDPEAAGVPAVLRPPPSVLAAAATPG